MLGKNSYPYDLGNRQMMGNPNISGLICGIDGNLTSSSTSVFICEIYDPVHPNGSGT